MPSTKYAMRGILLLSVFYLLPGQIFAQVDSTVRDSKKIKILTYGLANYIRDYEEDRIAARYGFTIWSVAGCVVGKQLMDSVEHHNDTAYSEIDKINKPGWRNKYNSEVDSAYKRDTILIRAVKSIHEVNEWIKSKPKTDLMYYVDSALSNNVYRISILSLDDSKTRLISLYRVYISYKTLKMVRKENTERIWIYHNNSTW